MTAEMVYRRHSQTKPGSETIYEVTDRILKKHIAAGTLPVCREGEDT